MDIGSYWNLIHLRRNLNLKATQLKELQFKKLKFVVKNAYENNPFYHCQLLHAGIKPDDLRSLADIHKLPLITKTQIQSTSTSDILAKTVGKYVSRTTSGSTGLTLKIFVDNKTRNIEEAVWARALMQNGLRLRDKQAIISDPRHFSGRDLSENIRLRKKQYISIFAPVENQLATLEAFKPDVIRSYVSPMVLLSEALLNDKKELEPRLIFTDAEQLTLKNRELISNAFQGCELFDNYACSEFSLLAWECHAHSGYHINADNLILEFLKEDEEVASGERGDVVCTSLTNQATPLIRYKLGDVGVKSDEECPCGVTLPLMKTIEGRIDDFLRATDGRLISPTIFFPYPFENIDQIRQFKVIQEGQDKLIIQIVVEGALEEKVLGEARREIQNVFGVDMGVEFQLIEKISPEPNGKNRKIISKLGSV